MLEHYKKRFWGMQATIAFVVFGVFLLTRQWLAAALFLVTMQVSALVGAAWASRLRRKMEPRG